MKTARTGLALLIALLAIGAYRPDPAFAEDSPVKNAAKQAGRDAKEMGKKAGKAAKEVGTSIGQASKRTYKTIKKEFRKDFLEGSAGNSARGNNSSDRR